MKFRIAFVVAGLLSLALSPVPLTLAQTATQTASALPRLVRFSGAVKDLNGNALTGTVGVTFALYSEQTGGSPLWLETQNVTADSSGRYAALLGATKPDGLPAELFTSEQARWVGVQVSGQPEQPRVLLVSAPYALKAGDAETIGGLPPSAFVLAAPPVSGSGSASPAASADGGSASPSTATDVTTTGGTANFFPFFNGGSTIIDSVVEQTGSGSTARIGIGTSTPAATLDVRGSTTVRGLLNLPAASTATAAAGSNSNGLGLVASTFNSGTSAAANQVFHWFAEPVGNNTASPSATLNLLFATAPNVPVETGLHIASNGQISFAPGQTFPGTGDGTITGVTAGTGLSGGGSSGNITLSVDTTKVPQLNAANTFTGNQTINGNLAATGTTTITGNLAVSGNVIAGGVVQGSMFEISGLVFGWGSTNIGTAYVGFAGNPSLGGGPNNTGVGSAALGFDSGGGENVAIGTEALSSNSSGSFNTAAGSGALAYNNGSSNTATGYDALANNGNSTVGSGNYNTATGANALLNNTSASGNTADGFSALFANNTGAYNTATGFEALATSVSANYNTATGYYALEADLSGGANTAMGTYALANNSSASANSAFGSSALSDSNGSENTGLGYYALQVTNTGNSNTAAGAEALVNNTSGSENIALGALACASNTTGNKVSCLGYNSNTVGADLQNATAIGAQATVSVSDAVVLGSVAGVNGATATARVGIGTNSPTNLLTLGRGFGPSIGDGWTTYSSRRWKTNIKTLPSALAKIEHLRGVSYDLKENGKHEIGVIAEEVGAVVPEVVTFEQNGKDARGVDYSRLTALLIEATKEQQREIRQERAILRAQTAAIRDLKSQLQVTRQTLLKVKAQVAASQPALVAVK
jgi:hypothetical protein